VVPILEHLRAIDKHVTNACTVLVRLLEGGMVLNPGRIEYGYIRIKTGRK
jgi:hypothetical protein